MAAADEELLLPPPPPPPPPPRLPELLETSQRLLDEVEVASEPTGSRAVQDKVRRGLALLQQAADMLAQLDLFRRHEALEDIASADLKYLAVPAFQGALAMRQVQPSRRRDHLQRAREHFVTYLTQCRYYRVADFELPPPRPAAESPPARPAPAEPSLLTMASRRQAKIQRYRRREEVEGRLAALKAAVEGGRADDERVREYYVLHLRRWVGISLEEIEGIDRELSILRENDPSREAAAAATTTMTTPPPRSPPPPTRPPMKPLVLARNVAQARVFGAGYPSLASMTVNEWYEQHRRCGALPGPGRAHAAPPPPPPPGRPEGEREGRDDGGEDEAQTRRRAREWDDWKDTHPKGYGNRHNMG
ncbi:immunoglobulin-binding protein 1-like isoform X1 [Sorex araneus]|uniref:immunoglobulin-binding protein 1-like isoform X1 n=1 Tax=Sorex araneus TaxID=42254 RepID=UPI002433B74B|nr:immunoglobulin-binding protein 1-like isoform X1 [Sorex araneus]